MSAEDFAKLIPSRQRRKVKRGFTEQEKKLLEELKPFIVGGETVTDSTYETYTL